MRMKIDSLERAPRMESYHAGAPRQERCCWKGLRQATDGGDLRFGGTKASRKGDCKLKIANWYPPQLSFPGCQRPDGRATNKSSCAARKTPSGRKINATSICLSSG